MTLTPSFIVKKHYQLGKGGGMCPRVAGCWAQWPGAFARLPSRLSSCNRLDLLDNKTEVQRGQRSCPEPQRQGARSVLIEFSVGYQLVSACRLPSAFFPQGDAWTVFILGVLGWWYPTECEQFPESGSRTRLQSVLQELNTWLRGGARLPGFTPFCSWRQLDFPSQWDFHNGMIEQRNWGQTSICLWTFFTCSDTGNCMRNPCWFASDAPSFLLPAPECI